VFQAPAALLDRLDIDIALPRRSFELRASLTLGTETIALVGPSGAGKTSLLRAVAGLDRPRDGHIALGAERWFDRARGIHLSPERRHTGYLPQDYGLFPHLTVAGNVRFAGRRERPDLLERVGVAHLASARPGQLSGGERQRVALARALARDPRVLLLDEPFAALDAMTRQQVRDELDRLLTDLRLPTRLVTHAFEDATALGNRVGVIEDGRLVQVATPQELLRNPANALVAALTGANVCDATAVPSGVGSTIHMVGGGELTSSTRADGAVQIAIQPWELTLDDAATSPLTDVVVSVRRNRGGLHVRLSRFRVETKLDDRYRFDLLEGRRVGLRVAPQDVRVLQAGLSSAPADLASAGA
jgi:molybdate transport system ATP-binding protein